MSEAKKPNFKFQLGIATIGIVILIFAFLPKKSKPSPYVPPRTGVRYVAPPKATQTPTNIDKQMIEVKNQSPSRILKIDSLNIDQPAYIIVEKDSSSIGQSELFTQGEENFEIELEEDTKNGDVLLIKVVDALENIVFQKEVLITNTSIQPNYILPRDLQ